MASNLGTAYIEILPSTDKLVPGIKNALGSEQSGPLAREGKRGGGILAGALGTAVKVGGAALVGAAAAGVGMAFTKGLDRYMKIENAEKKLGALGHSADTVKTIMDGALKSVKGTAFGLGDAADVAASAVASGIKPGQQLDQVLRTIANTAAIAGTDMGSMGAIFNKVAAGGKIQGDELAQLADRGVPALQWLSKELGVSAGEVAKMASKGQIDFATFERAMRNGMDPDAAVQMGDTLTGTWDNLGAAMGRLGAEVMTRVGPAIKDAMKGATEAVDGATKVIGPALDTVITGMTGLYDLMVNGDYTPALREAFGIFEDEAAVSGMLAVRDTINQLRLGAQGLYDLMVNGDYTPALREAFGIFEDEDVVTGMLGIRDTLGRIGERFQELWVTVQPIAQQIFDMLATKWAEIQPAVRSIFDSVVSIIWSALLVIEQVVAQVTSIIAGIWNRWGGTMMAVTGGLVTGIVGILQGLFRSVEGIWELLSGMLTGNTDRMASGVRKIFEGFSIAIRGIVSGLLQAITGIWGGIKQSFAGPVNWVINNVINPLADAVNKVAATFGAKWRVPRVSPIGAAAGRNAGGSHGSQRAMATGGRVPGYSPTATADNIPIWATAGEFMIREVSTRRIERKHRGLLDYMNRTGHLPPGYEPEPRGYAGGGRIIPNATQGFANYYPPFLNAIRAWAAATGMTWSMTGNGGARSFADQLRAWNLYKSGRGPLAANPYRGGPHMVPGRAMDLSPRPGNFPAARALLGRFGLGLTVRGEPWHVGWLAGGRGGPSTGPGTGGDAGAPFDPFAGVFNAIPKKVPGGGMWADILSALPGRLISMAVESAGRLFDSGGFLEPGLNLAVNNTGRREPVLTAHEWDMLEESLLAGDDTLRDLARMLDNRPVQVVVDGRVLAESQRKHNRSVS